MELAESNAEKTLISWAFRIVGTPEEVAEFRCRLPQLVLECTSGTERADIPITGLGLSSSTVSSIRDHGIDTLGGLLQLTENDLRMWRPFSWAKQREVKYALQRLGLKLKEPAQSAADETEEEEPDREMVCSTIIKDAGFSVRTTSCLRMCGVDTIGQLLEKTEAELLSMRHFGRKSLVEIQEWLKNRGMALSSEPMPTTLPEEN